MEMHTSNPMINDAQLVETSLDPELTNRKSSLVEGDIEERQRPRSTSMTFKSYGFMKAAEIQRNANTTTSYNIERFLLKLVMRVVLLPVFVPYFCIQTLLFLVVRIALVIEIHNKSFVKWFFISDRDAYVRMLLRRSDIGIPAFVDWINHSIAIFLWCVSFGSWGIRPRAYLSTASNNVMYVIYSSYNSVVHHYRKYHIQYFMLLLFILMFAVSLEDFSRFSSYSSGFVDGQTSLSGAQYRLMQIVVGLAVGLLDRQLLYSKRPDIENYFDIMMRISLTGIRDSLHTRTKTPEEIAEDLVAHGFVLLKEIGGKEICISIIPESALMEHLEFQSLVKHGHFASIKVLRFVLMEFNRHGYLRCTRERRYICSNLRFCRHSVHHILNKPNDEPLTLYSVLVGAFDHIRRRKIDMLPADVKWFGVVTIFVLLIIIGTGTQLHPRLIIGAWLLLFSLFIIAFRNTKSTVLLMKSLTEDHESAVVEEKNVDNANILCAHVIFGCCSDPKVSNRLWDLNFVLTLSTVVDFNSILYHLGDIIGDIRYNWLEKGLNLEDFIHLLTRLKRDCRVSFVVCKDESYVDFRASDDTSCMIFTINISTGNQYSSYTKKGGFDEAEFPRYRRVSKLPGADKCVIR